MADLTQQEAAAALNGGLDPTTCPECGREFETVQAMRGHLASHRRGASQDRAKQPPGAGTPKRAETVAVSQLLDTAGREVVAKAVKNAKADAHILAFVAPHVGLAISGQDPDKQPAEWRRDNPGAIFVQSRAELAGELILEIRDPDVLRTVLRVLTAYNSLHEFTKGGKLIGDLAVAGAVDARVIPPDFKIEYGPIQLPIAEATIGDVVAEWERRGLYQRPEGPPPEGAEDGEHPPWPPTGQPPGAEVVQGGVENT